MKKTYIIIISTLLLFLMSCSNQDVEVDCYTEVEKTVDGYSMSPMLNDKDRVFLLDGYYRCEIPQKGDLIAYDYGLDGEILIKLIKATYEDDLLLSGDRLYINDNIMVNSIGDEYIFSEEEQNMMGMYITDFHIPKDTYFIFGDNVNYSRDSRKFGAVGRTDLLGKFILTR